MGHFAPHFTKRMYGDPKILHIFKTVQKIFVPKWAYAMENLIWAIDKYWCAYWYKFNFHESCNNLLGSFCEHFLNFYCAIALLFEWSATDFKITILTDYTKESFELLKTAYHAN